MAVYTAAQLQADLRAGGLQQAAANNYIINHLGNEPAGVKVTGPGGVAGTLDNAATTTGSVVSGAVTTTATVGKFLGDLVDPKHLLRILMVVVGLLAVLFGLKYALDASRPASPGSSTTVVPVPI